MMSLKDRGILAFLSEDAGYTTRQISVHLHGNANARSVSQWTRQELLRLKDDGLIIELDDRKPVCWKLTAKGIEALRKEEFPSQFPPQR